MYHDYFIHLDLPPFLCSCLPNHLKDFTKTQKDCVTNSLSQDLRDLLNAVHHSLAFVLALIITFMIKIRFIFFKIMSRFSQNTLLLVRFLFLFIYFYLFGCAVLILLRYMLGCMWTAARRTKLGRFHFLLCSFLQL